jgi:hypothetical protein
MALTDNILAYWNLNDDGSGGVSLVDSTGNGYTLTNNGDVTLGSGIIDGGAVFTSAGGTSLTNSSLSTSGDWSISWWVNVTSSNISAEYPVAFVLGDINGTFIHAVLGDHNPTSNWIYSSPENQNYGQFYNTSLNTWYHYVLSNDPTNALNWYINGSLYVENGGGGINRDFTGITLGQGNSTGEADCIIDEVGVWNRALTPIEVTALYNNGIGLTYPFNSLSPAFIKFKGSNSNNNTLFQNTLAYWNLDDDGSGNVSLVDSTGNGYTLTNNNGVTLGTGIIGGDAVFSGIGNQYLGPVTLGIQNSYSVGVWLKWAGFTGNGVHQIFYSSASELGMQFFFNESNNPGYISLANYGVSPEQFETGIPIPADGSWHYYVFTQDGSGNFTFYLDATSVYTNTFTTGSTLPGYPTGIGAESSSLTQTFNGQIDEVGTWNRSLSPTEVTALYNNGSGLSYGSNSNSAFIKFKKDNQSPLLTDILAYWNLNDDGSGGVSLVDSTLNGNTLTNNNGVTLGTGIIGGASVYSISNGSYLRVSTLNYNVDTGDISMSIWVNPTTYGTGGYGSLLGSIFDTRDLNNNQQGWLLSFLPLGYLSLFSQLTTVYQSTNPIPLNTWTNIVLTKKEGITSIYINGEFDQSFSDNTTISSQIFTLGGIVDEPSNGSYLHYDGIIDEVGVWNRALTQVEVTLLYNSGAGLTYPFRGNTTPAFIKFR